MESLPISYSAGAAGFFVFSRNDDVMKNLFAGLAMLALFALAADATAQRNGGGRGNGGGGRSGPQNNPGFLGQQPGIRVPGVGVPDVGIPNVRVPGVNGGGNLNGGAGIRVGGNSGVNGIGINRAANQAIYRNNINIGQRSFNVAPNNYRPTYQNHSWHNGYWNNSYGWNPQIGYGQGYGGYGNYGGYRIRLGNIGISTGGLGGYGGNYGGYGYGRYPTGWGYGGWGLGNVLYRSGYSSYYNPYWGSGVAIGSSNYAYDYAQPVYVTSTETAPADVANRDFDAARQAFKANDYDSALALVNKAIKESPNDEVLHEFRSLTQFALRDYNGAAATIHSVLAVGPGWDWTTMASLYSEVGEYTAQLRALESFSKSKPADAASQFLLGYHYMTTGHPEHAAKKFSAVVKIQPKDQVARDLLALVDKPNEGDEAIAPAPRDTATEDPTVVAKPEVDASPISADAIAGSWKASRDDGSKFDLDLRKDKTFTWKFDQDKRHEDFSGTYTTEGSLLLLQKKDGGAMVGHVASEGDGKFTFKLLGSPKEDPGLTFSR